MELRALAPLRQGAGDLRPLPGDREALRPLRPGRVPHDGARRPSGTTSDKLWRIEHRPRRHDAGQVRDLRQRHAVQAQAVEDRRHGDASRATRSTPRAGTTTTPARTWRTSPTRSSASSAPAPRPCRRSRASARRPRSSTSSSARRRASTSATTGRPIRNGRRALQPGWQEARRMKHMRGREGDPKRKAELAALSREEKIRRQENANIDHMMRIHRRIEEIVKDKATAEALKPWYMFMCKRPCFDDDYLPAFNLPNVHLVDTHGKGITEIGAEGPGVRGPDLSARPADLRHRLRGAEDRHLQRDPRPRRARDQRDLRRRHAHPVRRAHPRLSRTCSSWAATRPRSSST